jgi:hypothetical protein
MLDSAAAHASDSGRNSAVDAKKVRSQQENCGELSRCLGRGVRVLVERTLVVLWRRVVGS